MDSSKLTPDHAAKMRDAISGNPAALADSSAKEIPPQTESAVGLSK